MVGRDLRDVTEKAIGIVRAVFAPIVHGSGPEEPTGKTTESDAQVGQHPLKVLAESSLSVR